MKDKQFPTDLGAPKITLISVAPELLPISCSQGSGFALTGGKWLC